MITTVPGLVDEISSQGATDLPLEVYDTSGRRYNVVAAYVDPDDGPVFCIDIEEKE